MKRMYVVLGVMFLFMAWTLTSLAQMVMGQPDITQTQPRPKFDRQKRRMELREEMHRRMRAKILLGQGSDTNLFEDMDLSAFDQMESVSANFQTEWTENTSGRTLIITPQSKEQQLNFDVNANQVTITGKSEQVSGNSRFSSNFSNSFPVPEDCDGTKVKMNQKDGKILVEFPFKAAAKTVVPPKKEERKPLPPSKSDVAI